MKMQTSSLVLCMMIPYADYAKITVIATGLNPIQLQRPGKLAKHQQYYTASTAVQVNEAAR